MPEPGTNCHRRQVPALGRTSRDYSMASESDSESSGSGRLGTIFLTDSGGGSQHLDAALFRVPSFLQFDGNKARLDRWEPRLFRR